MDSGRQTPLGQRDGGDVPGRDPPMRDFAHSLPMALLRAREAAMGYFRPALQRHGVTEQQWRIVRALYDGGDLEISELARRCCMLMPSISGVLRRMQNKGLVRRSPDAGDQRRSIISLTAKARRLMQRVAPHSEASYAEIERAFGTERLRLLYDLILELETALEPPVVARDNGAPRRK